MKDGKCRATCTGRISSMIVAGFCLPASLLFCSGGAQAGAPQAGHPEVLVMREALSFREIANRISSRNEIRDLLEGLQEPVFSGDTEGGSETGKYLSTVQCACSCACNCFCHCHCHK